MATNPSERGTRDTAKQQVIQEYLSYTAHKTSNTFSLLHRYKNLVKPVKLYILY